jgi:hypothetical protein
MNTKAYLLIEFPTNTVDNKMFNLLLKRFKDEVRNYTGYNIPVQGEYQELFNGMIYNR